MRCLLILFLNIAFYSDAIGLTCEEAFNKTVARIEGKEIEFRATLPSGTQLRLVAKDDRVPRVFSSKDRPYNKLLFIEMLPVKPDETDSLAALATIKVSGDTLDVVWMESFNYRKIISSIEKFRSEKRSGMSLMGTLKHIVENSRDSEASPEMRLLLPFLEQRVFNGKDVSDEDFLTYLNTQAKKQFRTKGMGYAIAEFISNTIPLGSKITFVVGNAETFRALRAGLNWERTALGRMATRAGFSKLEFNRPEGILVKTGDPEPYFNWIENEIQK